MTKHFDVYIYYSGQSIISVVAKNEEEAKEAALNTFVDNAPRDFDWNVDHYTILERTI